MITRGVEDSSDAEPQALLHDGLRGLIQSFLENVQGSLGLPGSVERHRGGVGKCPSCSRSAWASTNATASSSWPLAQGGKSARLASNAGWSGTEEIRVQPRNRLGLSEVRPGRMWLLGNPARCSACFSGVPIRRVFPRERGSAQPVEAALDLRVVR